MKKLCTILAALTLVVLCFFLTPAEAEAAEIVVSGTCGTNVTWALDSEGTLTISGMGKMTDYAYDFSSPTGSTHPWKDIASSIKKVVIEDGVTHIGYYAFRGCTSLTSVTIPDSVTSIGDSAFSKCTGLASVTIPDSVTSIGDYAFSNCTGLASVTIPDSVTSIGSSAFYNCTSLTSVTIPDSVTSIGDSAFSNCTGLASVTIPDGVTSIGYGAFYGCIRLKTIEIPDSVTSIGAYAFRSCTNLTSVTIPDSVTSIGGSAFASCTGLTSVTIPESVTSIGDYVFDSCTSLTSVTIPESVTSIGDDAFSGCTSLTSITIPDSVTSIGSYAFYNCTSLTSVNITDIAAWCNISFYGYYSNPLYYVKKLYLNGTLVTELVIPDSVTSIGSYAFYNCTSLTSVTIGDGVTNISNSAFYNCYSLKEILLPKGMDTIGSNAFSWCSRLETVYHKGDQDDWDWIVINTGNDYLKNANIIHNFAGDTIPGVCNHQWQVATCTTAKTCTLCGRVEGTAPGHSWVNATCVAPKTCTTCGTTEGQALGHLLSITTEAKEPTCTEDGWTFGLQCVNDGCTYQVVSKPWKANGHSYAHGFCSGCGMKDPNGPPIDANLVFSGTPGLSFQDYIGIQIMFQNSKAKDYDKYYVEITQITPDGPVTTISAGAPFPGYETTFTLFEQQIVSWSMTEQVTMTLYAEKDGVKYQGASITTTVEELALEKAAGYAGKDEARCRTMVDVLNYGAAVQIAFDHNAANLPNTKLGDLAQYGTQTQPEMTAENVISGSGAAKVAANNISLQDKVEFNFMVKDTTLASYTPKATLNGAEVAYQITSVGSGYSVVRVAIGAANMRSTYTFALYDANGNVASKVYNVSAEAYAREKLTGTTGAAYVAMMQYGDSVASIK